MPPKTRHRGPLREQEWTLTEASREVFKELIVRPWVYIIYPRVQGVEPP